MMTRGDHAAILAQMAIDCRAGQDATARVSREAEAAALAAGAAALRFVQQIGATDADEMPADHRYSYLRTWTVSARHLLAGRRC